MTGLGNKGPLKVLNGTKLILDDHGNNLDSFRISLESFRSFRDPLLLKQVTGQELSFAVSYSKLALIGMFIYKNRPSKSHQLPFDQEVQKVTPPRYWACVPETDRNDI